MINQRKGLLLFVLLFLFGCEVERIEVPIITKVGDRIQYIQDDRTNLCFARYCAEPFGGGCYHGSASNVVLVPCQAFSNITKIPVEVLK
jgi:hypothetical protein